MSKYYGEYPAVIDVSFNISKGESIGLLGPNGAGKSTTMKVMTGYTPPTSGNVNIGGHHIIKNSIDKKKLDKIYISSIDEAKKILKNKSI